VVVVWYGSTLVLTDVMTAGDLISFLLYTLNIAASVGSLSASVGTLWIVIV
jgi:ABC-type bacteriocin/lantibiotic exporter with double-glycine peptidase domain